MKIEAGETVAFVGKTGSGKSTLVSLVPRLLDAPDDAIFIDRTPIRRFPLAQIRRAIGFVPQETFLFSDTLSENIAFGVDTAESSMFKVQGSKPENGNGNSSGVKEANGNSDNGKSASGDLQSEIERAAEIAALADDIKGFPYQYKQLVGERGITLSGGQKQRTAIARAVMRNPRILILDDALSAVDTYTEEKILNGLRDVRQNRTTLIVSHRVSTVRDADLICVMHDGRIIERGTHNELLKHGGEYADLYERQLLEEEISTTE